MGTKLSYENVFSEIDPSLGGGSAEASLGVNLLNVKLGAKWGITFYFRPELGYALASVADNIEVSVEFPDGSTETRSGEVPGIVGGGFVANIGFGISF